MKKNLMFFVLGVSATLLMGAGISHWNQISQENKYGVWMGDTTSGVPSIPSSNKYGIYTDDNSAYYGFVPSSNKYGIYYDTRADYTPSIPSSNKYGIYMDIRADYAPNIPPSNKYALVLDGAIGDDAKKAMATGFIFGMAVGRKKAEEEANTKSGTPNRDLGF